ncbi:MAG: AAA family ATPase [Planctomycetes bacterium]|nr:AAA family ATPase [Planctomycetota bacterium]
MYEVYYGFKEKPFNLTPDPAFLYLSPGHKKVMSYLTYGLESGEGFIQVTGEIGSGKTTLVRNLRNLISSVHPDHKLAHILNPRGTFRQLLRLILDELGVVAISDDQPRERLLAAFRAFVEDQAAKGLPVVIIFDEAQNIDPVALEEIRMLSNIEDDKKKLVQIIFVGQPELRSLLASPELEQLSQRIAVKCHLKPLSLEETQKYIRHRLEVAGAANGTVKFSSDAGKVLHAYSRGIPRRINVAANAVLLAGFVDEKRSFNGKFVRAAIADLEGADDFDIDVSEFDEQVVAAAQARDEGSRVSKAKIGLLVGAAVVITLLGSWLAFADGINIVRSAFKSFFS